MKSTTSRGPSLLVLCAAMFGCAADNLRPGADEEPRKASYAISPTLNSPLRAALSSQESSHPGRSGLRLVTRGDEAFDLRIRMIQAAQHTVDLQYYLVEDDDADKLLLQSLLRASDRGVRIRMLVDSLNTDKDDSTWALLNEQKNIQIRIWNPLNTHAQSFPERMVNSVMGLGHFDRRMHNKILVADNQLAITGGRNLGESYFEASKEVNFHDADILAAGPIVPELSKSFDRYWNDDESFPFARVGRHDRDPEKLKKFRAELEKRWQKNEAEDESPARAPLPKQLGHEIKLTWAKTELAADSPTKLDRPPGEVQSKPEKRLIDMATGAHHEFIMVSPYFVPRDEGMEWISGLTQKNVKVRILTNSLASTDAVAPQTGYRDYREALLDSGADLYELKPTGKPTHSGHYKSNAPSSLHSKMYMIDRRDLLIGSFNFDPRSIELNTEQVLVIHSPEIASQAAAIFDESTLPENSFHVVKDDGTVTWKTEEKGKEVSYTHDPEVGLFRRAEYFLVSLLPVEDEL